MNQPTLTRIVTLEGIPGTLDILMKYLQGAGVVVIPKSSDTRGNDVACGIVSCARDMLIATKQIKKCMGSAHTIIVPHYFDVPVIRDPVEFQFARRFMSRHIEQILRVFELDRVHIEHIHIRIPYEYVYEILLSTMSCRTLGTGDFSLYTKHLLHCPDIRHINVQLGAFYTKSMIEEIVNQII